MLLPGFRQQACRQPSSGSTWAPGQGLTVQCSKAASVVSQTGPARKNSADAARSRSTTTEFHRSGRDLLDEADLYRLCWSGTTLRTKDTVSASRP